jgi:hypothetical protein
MDDILKDELIACNGAAFDIALDVNLAAAEFCDMLSDKLIAGKGVNSYLSAIPGPEKQAAHHRELVS